MLLLSEEQLLLLLLFCCSAANMSLCNLILLTICMQIDKKNSTKKKNISAPVTCTIKYTYSQPKMRTSLFSFFFFSFIFFACVRERGRISSFSIFVLLLLRANSSPVSHCFSPSFFLDGQSNAFFYYFVASICMAHTCPNEANAIFNRV